MLLMGAIFHQKLERAILYPRDFVGQLLDPTDWFPFEERAAFAQNVNFPGIPNFGGVTPVLYRGGQPTAEGLRALRRLGVQIVVNFRYEPEEIAAEQDVVEKWGMRFVSIPWKTSDRHLGPPLAEFIQLVRSNPDRKIFVHCKAGRDRTGFMVAAYRIADQHWTPRQAVAEMQAFGFRADLLHFWHHHLDEYIDELPQQLEADPFLRPLKLGHSWSGSPGYMAMLRRTAVAVGRAPRQTDGD